MFDEGIQSYFGESDSNFFGDTSNDMIFGEGYGEQAVDGAQFFSEAVGFSSDGGEFISEATAFDTTTGDYFTEAEVPSNHSHEPPSPFRTVNDTKDEFPHRERKTRNMSKSDGNSNSSGSESKSADSSTNTRRNVSTRKPGGRYYPSLPAGGENYHRPEGLQAKALERDEAIRRGTGKNRVYDVSDREPIIKSALAKSKLHINSKKNK